MYHHMYGSGWGGVMMLFWLLVLGGVVYCAFRLAVQRQHKPSDKQ